MIRTKHKIQGQKIDAYVVDRVIRHGSLIPNAAERHLDVVPPDATHELQSAESWELTKEKSLFVNFSQGQHETRSAIYRWALRERLLKAIPLFCVFFKNETAEPTIILQTESLLDAKAAVTAHPGSKLDVYETVVTTNDLQKWQNVDQLQGDAAEHIAAATWAERFEFDGIWWDDNVLGTITGKLFVSNLDRWHKNKITQ